MFTAIYTGSKNRGPGAETARRPAENIPDPVVCTFARALIPAVNHGTRTLSRSPIKTGAPRTEPGRGPNITYDARPGLGALIPGINYDARASNSLGARALGGGPIWPVAPVQGPERHLSVLTKNSNQNPAVSTTAKISDPVFGC